MIKAKVTVMPKASVLDPQGEAVRKAIHGLGMECVSSARIGKSIELEIQGTDLSKTRQQLEEISYNLLSNPVIEDYKIELGLVED
ncbi:MAG: phosphoribosylformylglycinamidine synthase subunit PurS [Verrucomicrobiota bacterium]